MRYSDWFFTGKIYDHPDKDISCGLCNHERLRYEYVIKNNHTQEQISVGSSCILKFADITIYDNRGNKVTQKRDRKKALKKAFEQFKFELSLVPLRILYSAMVNNISDREITNDQKRLEDAVKWAKQNNGFMPNDLVWLFSSMKNRGIEYHPGLYKLYIRDLSSKVDFKMVIKNPLKLDLIYGALNASQKKSYDLSDRKKM